MAEVLKLVRFEDVVGDIDSLDLLTSGFSIDYYEQAAGPHDGDDLAETANVNIIGSSHDNLAALVQSLDDKIIQANDYINGRSLYGVFVRKKLKNETNTRQSLITLARPDPKINLDGLFTRADTALGPYALGLQRRPWWEAIAYTEISGSAISLLGGVLSYTGLVGDIPARLALFVLSAANTLGELWVGFRSSTFGTLANFVPVWNLRKCTTFSNNTTGGTSNADATAQDGYKVVVDIGSSPTLLERLRIAVSDVALPHGDDQRGRYQVICRARNTGTLLSRIRLADGWLANTDMAFHDLVPVLSTSWFLYDLGQVEIPSPFNFTYGSYEIDYYSLRIDAERISGSGNLELDCFVLIPLEGSIHTTSQVAIGAIYAQYKASGKKMIRGVVMTGGYQFLPPQIDGGPYPGSGRIVIAGQRPTVQTLADTAGIVSYVYPRWMNLRGAE